MVGGFAHMLKQGRMVSGLGRGPKGAAHLLLATPTRCETRGMVRNPPRQARVDPFSRPSTMVNLPMSLEYLAFSLFSLLSFSLLSLSLSPFPLYFPPPPPTPPPPPLPPPGPSRRPIDGAGDSTALVLPVSTPFHVAFPLFLLSVAEPDSRTGQDRTVGHKAVSLNHASSSAQRGAL